MLSRISESLPNILGVTDSLVGASNMNPWGGLYIIGSAACNVGGDGGKYWKYHNFGLDASRWSNTYKEGAPVRPESYSTKYMIKFD